MIERTVELDTPDGTMPTFVTYPDEAGPHPVVLYFMDAFGFREELYDLCRRIATVGYYVMMPHLYHRVGSPDFDTSGLPDRRDPRVAELVEHTGNAGMRMDTAACLRFAGSEPGAADAGTVGAVGTCMGAPPALYAAVDHPGRVRCFASWHGARLMTDAEDSPHLQIPRLTRAEAYFAWSPEDRTAPAAVMAYYQRELDRAGIVHRIELHDGAPHGYTFPTRWCFNKDAAERTWERTLNLFGRRLPRRD